MKTIAVTLLVSSVALFSAASARSATDPSPPQVLEEALAACAKHREGSTCEVRISQVDNKGVCVVFTRGDLVCAIDAPP